MNLVITGAALLAYLGVFILVVRASPSYSFYTGDQGLKYLQIKAVLEQGPLNPALPQKAVPWEVLDLVSQDAMTYEQDGSSYSVYSNMFAIVTAPFYRLAGYPGLFILPFFSVLGSVILIGRLLSSLGYGSRRQLISVFVILGSPMAVYGMVLWEHGPTAFLCCIALTLLMTQKKTGAVFFAGLSIGFACSFRPESLIFGLALALSFLLMGLHSRYLGSRPPKKFRMGYLKGFSYMGGIMVGYLPQIILDFCVSGALFSRHIAMQASGASNSLFPDLGDNFFSVCGVLFSYLVWGRLYYAFNVFLGELWLIITLCAIGALLGRIVLKKASFQIKEKWVAVLLLIFLIAGVAWTLWRHVHNGAPLPENNFWFTFPAAFGTLLLILRYGRFDDNLRFLLFVSVMTVLLKILIYPLGGGVQWGFRMMLPVALPLAMIFAIKMEAAKAWECRKALLLLLLFGFIVQGAAIKNIVLLRKQMATVPANLEQLTQPGDVILTPYIHLYQICPTLYDTRSILWVKNNRNIDPILEALPPETSIFMVAKDKKGHWPKGKPGSYRLSPKRIGLGWAGLTLRPIERQSQKQ